MPAPIVQLIRDMFSGDNRRPCVVLLTSTVCLAAWHVMGNYSFWQRHLSQLMSLGLDLQIAAAVWYFIASVLFLGIVPLLIVKFLLRDSLADYGMRRGDLRFGLTVFLLTAPLLVAIGYFSAQSPEFQAFYPLNPIARQSASALTWNIVGQLFWYAAWEFHFRGFLQHGLEKFSSLPVAICVQTLASTLAHFGRPGAELFASILAGFLWGALAWRTRSLLSGFLQHWLLGASLDIFLCRRLF